MNSERFEERELKPYAEPLKARDLKVGSVYFFLNYIDDEMLLPSLQPMVFIGRDLESTDSGIVYFQDAGSYRRGFRYESTVEGDEATFCCGSENETGHVFEYERALEALMRCSLRRRRANVS